MTRTWAVSHPGGYEVSSLGDRRFSALYARLRDGRTIEQAYQLDVKGYRAKGNDWHLGKGKAAIHSHVDLWAEYLKLWQQWANENPELISDLSRKSWGKVLTDAFSTRSSVNQAHALAVILEDYEQL